MTKGRGDVAAIRLENVRKTYGATCALRGVSFQVGAGEICGLIGPDGAGKTTAMRIVCGLIHPDEGRATVMGIDSALEGRRLKNHLGYMPQRFSLYADLTVAENLRFFADLFGVSRQTRCAREERLMEFSRLGPFRHRRAGHLSGGMKQKLALSCTLIHQPQVLVLDEPTTGVDPVSRREFWTILRELAGEGITLLVSTPYMDEAALCHRIVMMHGGEVLAEGPPAEVTSRAGHRSLEISGPDTAAARDRLLRMDIPGIDVQRFGARLRVLHDTEDEAALIREGLSGLEVEVRTSSLRMEDGFVALMERRNGFQRSPSREAG